MPPITIYALMHLLQVVAKPIVSSELTAGNVLNGTLLTGIIGLLIYIWQDNKKNTEKKHQDVIVLVETVQKEQLELKKKQQEYDYQLLALNAAINLAQGKPWNYDNTKILDK